MNYHLFKYTRSGIKYAGTHYALWNGPWERAYIKQVHDLTVNDLLLIDNEFWWLLGTGWTQINPIDDGPSDGRTSWGMLLANKLRSQAPANNARDTA